MWKTFLAGCLLAWPATAQIPGLTFEQIPLPSPRDINPYSLAAGTGGRIWFADVTFRQVGFIEPSGTISKFRLTDSVDPTNEVRPLSIVEGPDGNAWFTLYVTNSSGSPLNRSAVGKVTASGAISIYPLPTGNSCRGLFGLPDCGITSGPDGNLWIVERGGVARITSAGVVTEFPLTATGLYLFDITQGSDGNLWATDATGNRIWRITTAGQATPFPVAGTAAVRGITRGPDGNVWFASQGLNSVGRITPAGAITMFPVPASGQFAGVYSITTGPDSNIWFTQTGDAQIGRLEVATGTIAEVAAPNGEAPVDIVAQVGINKIAPDAIGDFIPLAINLLNASTRDFGIARAKLAPATPGPHLTVTKRPIQNFTRRGNYVGFLIEVTNSGDAPATNWGLDDRPGEGLEECDIIKPFNEKERFSKFDDLIGGQTVLHIVPKNPTLTAGGKVSVEVWCLVLGEGRKFNTVALVGTGAGNRSATTSIEAFNELFGIHVGEGGIVFYDPAQSGRR